MCVMEQSASPSLGETAVPRYAVGIDIGSESCSFCTLKSDKRVVIKPTAFANAASGFVFLTEKLEALGVSAHHILIGLEATSRDARKSLPLSAKPRLPDILATSSTNSPICTTAWVTSKNRQVGCQHHRQSLTEWRGSSWLCTR